MRLEMSASRLSRVRKHGRQETRPTRAGAEVERLALDAFPSKLERLLQRACPSHLFRIVRELASWFAACATV